MTFAPREIKEALAYGGKEGGAGRLFKAARDPQKWQEIISSPHYRGYLRELVDEAEELLRTPIKSLPYSLFKLFWETGSRREYEREFFAHRTRLSHLAILVLAYGDFKYLEALEDAIWAICDEFTWCLPAHLGKTCPRGGQDPDDQAKALDLFSTETGFALAEIISLLEGEGRPGLARPVVARARQEIFRRVLEPYLSLNQPLWWESAAMNWAAVCAGSIGAAALYLMEDMDRLALLLNRVLQTMASYLSGFGADGACAEGVSYWAYGFGYFTYFAALLLERTAGEIDLFRADKVKEIALFLQKCYLTGNHVVSFSDSPLTFDYPPGLMAYLQNRFEEISPPAAGCAALTGETGSARWPVAIRDLVWGMPRTEIAGETGETVFYLGDVQWLISRKNAGPSRIRFAAKGGHNDEPHNHNDIGSFVLHVDGDTLLADPGRGEYTRGYFGPERYRYFCAGSQGHSVPIIDGRYQKEGPEHAARILESRSTDAQDVFVMEIAGAYDDANLKSLRRSFVFVKTAPVHLLLVDEFVFERPPRSVVERLISFFEPVVLDPGRILIAGGRGRVVLEYPCREMHLQVGQEIFVTQEHEEKTAHTIDLVHDCLSTNFSIELRFLCAQGG
ncbi:MAG: heparinase II/III-family protein [Alicyclobacillus sp.]|nr:heparinase II/III-family protein [Alicyclobacillus sp.]